MSEAAVALVQAALDEKNEEIATKVPQSLLDERDSLAVALKKLTRGSKAPGEAPATSDEALVEAVGTLGGPSTSTDIGKHLGVDVRTISRRLAKLASTDVISGNKDDGYTS